MTLDGPTKLLTTFLTHRPAPAPGDPSALARLLDARLLEARQAWPGVGLTAEVFAQAVAERVDAGVEPGMAVEGLHTSDLYLAVACAQGEAAALAHFDRAYLTSLGAILSRISGSVPNLDDTRQLIRQRLLVRDGVAPRIATYSGKGSLFGWFKTAALRCALNQERAKRARPLEVELGERPVIAAGGGETALARARHRDSFQAALRHALAQLSPEQRLLLRWHFFEGLTLTRIAELQGASKSTVSRHLSAAREQVLSHTRAELQVRLQVPTSEISSLVQVLIEGANATLSDLLSRT